MTATVGLLCTIVLAGGLMSPLTAAPQSPGVDDPPSAEEQPGVDVQPTDEERPGAKGRPAEQPSGEERTAQRSAEGERVVDLLTEQVPPAEGKSARTLAEAAPKAGIMAAAPSAAKGTKNAGLTSVSYQRENLPSTQTIKSIRVSQESSGRVRTVATFAKAPTASAPTRLDVALGRWNGNSCVTEFELRSVTDNTGAGGFGAGQSWSGSVPATVKRSGATLSAVTTARNDVKAATWDCAWALSIVPVGAQIVQGQGFYAEDLRAPKLKVTGGKPVQGTAKGRWLTMRLKVANTGHGTAWDVKLKPSGKSMSFKPGSRTIGTMKGRSSRYVTVKVKLKGRKARPIRHTATATGGHQASKKFTVAHKAKAKKYKNLSGRYFWGHRPTNLSSSTGWDTTAVWFLNSKWVYVGFPKKSTKPTCRKVTKNCKRYTYNRKKGTAKIGKQRFKISTHGFSYRTKKGTSKARFEPLTRPKKGARIGADLIHQNWSGNCTISCTSYTERITLGKNGRFLRSRYSLGSWPGLGQNWGSFPADQRGTYRIIGQGRIEFRYANGKRSRQRIGIAHDVRGKAAPVSGGLVIGKTNFYFQD